MDFKRGDVVTMDGWCVPGVVEAYNVVDGRTSVLVRRYSEAHWYNAESLHLVDPAEARAADAERGSGVTFYLAPPVVTKRDVRDGVVGALNQSSDATKRPWGPPPGPRPTEPPRDAKLGELLTAKDVERYAPHNVHFPTRCMPVADLGHVADTVCPVIRPAAHCPRCYGPARPAYTGLFSHEPLRCERVGGCWAEKEPSGVVYWSEFGRPHTHELAWYVVGSSKPYATRDLAVAAWREAAIAKAKAEHERGGR